MSLQVNKIVTVSALLGPSAASSRSVSRPFAVGYDPRKPNSLYFGEVTSSLLEDVEGNPVARFTENVWNANDLDFEKLARDGMLLPDRGDVDRVFIPGHEIQSAVGQITQLRPHLRSLAEPEGEAEKRRRLDLRLARADELLGSPKLLLEEDKLDRPQIDKFHALRADGTLVGERLRFGLLYLDRVLMEHDPQHLMREGFHNDVAYADQLLNERITSLVERGEDGRRGYDIDQSRQAIAVLESGTVTQEYRDVLRAVLNEPFIRDGAPAHPASDGAYSNPVLTARIIAEQSQMTQALHDEQASLLKREKPALPKTASPSNAHAARMDAFKARFGRLFGSRDAPAQVQEQENAVSAGLG